VPIAAGHFAKAGQLVRKHASTTSGRNKGRCKRREVAADNKADCARSNWMFCLDASANCGDNELAKKNAVWMW